MSDVFQIATKCRGRLKADLAKVEEFLRMAEEFSKESDPEARLAFAKTTANASPPQQPAIELTRRTPKEAATA